MVWELGIECTCVFMPASTRTAVPFHGVAVFPPAPNDFFSSISTRKL
jgi:hypothetical protein